MNLSLDIAPFRENKEYECLCREQFYQEECDMFSSSDCVPVWMDKYGKTIPREEDS